MRDVKVGYKWRYLRTCGVLVSVRTAVEVEVCGEAEVQEYS